MRRKDKEIKDISEIESIIDRALVCRLALADENRPYIVPMCFGYKDQALYFHSASKGKKLEILKKNNQVCFEFDIDSEIIKADKACDWTMRYKSVIGYGTAVFIEEFEAKCRALDIIMQHYANRELVFPEAGLKHIVVIKVEIAHMTGKMSGWGA